MARERVGSPPKAHVMVETCHLLPPLSGPQSDPLLFGVAEALACLFPVEDMRLRTVAVPPEQQDEERVEEPLAA